MAKVEHYEIPVDDMARASAFYSATLGLGYEPWGDDTGMLRSGTGEGIDGDIHVRGSVLRHPTVVFTVDRIEETLALVVANGGEQLGEIEAMGETARFAYFRDTEGNVIGVYDDNDPAEIDPAAG